jgi:hypothetical protein
VLRLQLLEELAAIGSADEGIAWAQRRLPAKNTLILPDAELIEQAFRRKMSSLEDLDGTTTPNVRDAGRAEQPDKQDAQNAPESHGESPQKKGRASDDSRRLGPVEDKSTAPFLKLVRKRDRAHRQFVCSQPCLICGRRPSDAHHLRFGQPRALGRRVSDEFIVPLCRVHHRDLHRRGDEKKWWSAVSIDPVEVSQRLWRESRGSQAQSD